MLFKNFFVDIKKSLTKCFGKKFSLKKKLGEAEEENIIISKTAEENNENQRLEKMRQDILDKKRKETKKILEEILDKDTQEIIKIKKEEQEKLERERLERERIERERLELERQKRLERERLERERI